MNKLLTAQDLKTLLRDEVAAAGGAKKWLKRHNGSLIGYSQILHMVENGDAAPLADTLRLLGYRRVTRFERVED